MTDLGSRALDLAQLRTDQERDHSIFRAIAPLGESGAPDCVDCGHPISTARRVALPSARRCVDCQTKRERGL